MQLVKLCDGFAWETLKKLHRLEWYKLWMFTLNYQAWFEGMYFVGLCYIKTIRWIMHSMVKHSSIQSGIYFHLGPHNCILHLAHCNIIHIIHSINFKKEINALIYQKLDWTCSNNIFRQTLLCMGVTPAQTGRWRPFVVCF